MNDIVPRDELNKTGLRAAGGVGGGVAVWVVNGIVGALAHVLAKIPILGWLFGAAGGIVSWVLGVAGLGLVVYGGWNLIKFLKGLKSRS